MLINFGIICAVGGVCAYIARKIGLPSIVGMIIAGVLISPYQWGWVSEDVFNYSADIRQIALVIILTRAGLSLNIDHLKRVGRPAILLSFLPAAIEMIGITLAAVLLLNWSAIDGALMASVLAAVSPAIVVPRMIHLIQTKRGTNRHIPEMILAGASLDDIFVIIFFTSILTLATTGVFEGGAFLAIPLTIGLGIGVGLLCGYLYLMMIHHFEMRDSYQIVMLLALSGLLLGLEQWVAPWVSFSALLAVMTLGMVVKAKAELLAPQLEEHYYRLWGAFELLLFVLVGINVDAQYLWLAGPQALLIVAIGLLFRMLGVLFSIAGTSLNRREKLFTAVAYLPKATVQAAIGSIPLSMGLESGQMILIVSVIAILFTAPLGAFLTDYTAPRWLKSE